MGGITPASPSAAIATRATSTCLIGQATGVTLLLDTPFTEYASERKRFDENVTRAFTEMGLVRYDGGSRIWARASNATVFVEAREAGGWDVGATVNVDDPERRCSGERPDLVAQAEPIVRSWTTRFSDHSGYPIEGNYWWRFQHVDSHGPP